MIKQNDTAPLVTIGIPTYNRAATYLPTALRSALAQTVTDLEVIVADNVSTDGTAELIRGWGDKRVRYVRPEVAVHPHENANFCLREARGRYILLLHDDDAVDVDFLEVCLGASARGRPGFFQTGARMIDGEGRVVREKENHPGGDSLLAYFQSILRGEGCTFFCNTLYDTELLRSAGGWSSGAHVYQDVLANIRLAARYGRVTCPEVKASYRLHSSKLGSASAIRRWCDDSLELLREMEAILPEERAFFRGEGRRMLCRRICGKRLRAVPPSERLWAACLVFQRFRHVPAGLIWRGLRRSRRGSREDEERAVA